MQHFLIGFLFLNCLMMSIAPAAFAGFQVEGSDRLDAPSVEKIFKKYPNFKTRPEELRAAVTEIDSLGLFEDIEVVRRSGHYIIRLTEKPQIIEIQFKGLGVFSEEDAIEKTGVRQFTRLAPGEIANGKEALLAAYREKGFFRSSIETEIKELSPSKVKLLWKVEERKKVRVRKIEFLGNNDLSEEFLRQGLAVQEQGLFSNGKYQKEMLLRDKEFLMFKYQNEGFAKVEIEEPRVSLSPDNRSLVIAYAISEGSKYKVQDVEFGGDLIKPDYELKEKMEVLNQDYFSRLVLMQDIDRIRAVYGDEGYAFANPNIRTAFNDETKQVTFLIDVEKGEKVKIGRIEVKGNSHTRDKVLRREIKLKEGKLYNETNKKESIANIQRLGYFESVDFQTKPSMTEENVMDVDVVVQEKSTGQLQIGAGYGEFSGFALQGSVQQANFRGMGQRLGASVNWSKREKLFNLNFTEPHFRDSQWSVGFDAYRNQRGYINFSEILTGGGIRVGKQLDDFWTVSGRYKIDYTELDLGTTPDRDLYPVSEEDKAEGLTSSLTGTLQYDKRDNSLYPTKGLYVRGSSEIAGLGGDISYHKTSLNLRYYYPLFGSLVWRNNLVYGYVNGFGETPPFNQLYRLGGPNTVRGYDYFTVAQRKFSNQALADANTAGHPYPNSYALRPFGGQQQLYYNMEFEWFLIKEAQIKGVVFFDMGQAQDSIDFGDFKYSVGFGFRWFSPMGPLRFEFGFPLDPDERFDENKSDFAFSIMSTF